MSETTKEIQPKSRTQKVEAPENSVFTLDDDVFNALRNLPDAGVTLSVEKSQQGQWEDSGSYGGGFVAFDKAGDWQHDDWPHWDGYDV